MPRLYIYTDREHICYSLDFGGCGSMPAPGMRSDSEAICTAIMYGLNSYYIKWNKELDARDSDMDVERSKATNDIAFQQVSTPADRTTRPLPPPVAVCIESEIVIKQLTGQLIASGKVGRHIKTIKQMAKNVEVKYELISRKENMARRII